MRKFQKWHRFISSHRLCDTIDSRDWTQSGQKFSGRVKAFLTELGEGRNTQPEETPSKLTKSITTMASSSPKIFQPKMLERVVKTLTPHSPPMKEEDLICVNCGEKVPKLYTKYEKDVIKLSNCVHPLFHIYFICLSDEMRGDNGQVRWIWCYSCLHRLDITIPGSLQTFV